MAQEKLRVSARAASATRTGLSHPARTELAEVVPFPGVKVRPSRSGTQAPMITRVLSFLRGQATTTGTPPHLASSPDQRLTHHHPSHVSVFGALRMPDDVA